MSDTLVLLAVLAVAAAAGAAVAVVAGRSRRPGAVPVAPTPDQADLRAELAHLRELVTRLGHQGAQQQGTVLAALDQAVRRTGELERTTDELRRVLASSPARGQWGERLADDVLRAAGLVEGVSYRRQQTLPNGGRPDVTFLLPKGRALHLDVKFPLDNYLRHLDAEGAEERAATEAAFLRDVRARVRELAHRDYADPRSTVGYVLAFVPNEAVYAFVHERDPGLVDLALAQRVVLCSPLTLFAVLAVVRQAVDAFLLEQTSDEILEVLGRFTHQWDQLTEVLDRLGRQLGTAQATFDALNGPRRRQLERQLDAIERLRSAPTAGVDPPVALRAAGE